MGTDVIYIQNGLGVLMIVAIIDGGSFETSTSKAGGIVKVAKFVSKSRSYCIYDFGRRNLKVGTIP